MKKILSLLTVITLTASGASSVISCSSQKSSSTTNTDKNKVNEIKNDIKNPNITLPFNTYPDTSNANTITAIKNELKNADPGIANNLDNITFEKVTLIPGQAVPVTATITVGSSQDWVVLQVTLSNPTDQQRVDTIKNKIKNTNITLLAGTNPDTSNTVTSTAIKNALIDANKAQALSTDDIKYITFEKATLKLGTNTKITAKILVYSAQTSVDLQVTLPRTNDQKAVQAIFDKIQTKKVSLPNGTDYRLTNEKTREAIKKALLEANTASKLTQDDVNKITLDQKVALSFEIFISVKATITVGTANESITLEVLLHDADFVRAQEIKDKIKQTNISVPGGTKQDTSNTNTIKAIKTSLQKANPTLTTDDLAKITFEKTWLNFDDPTKVTATITFGTGIKTIDLQVTLPAANKYEKHVKGIKDKIKVTNLFLKSDNDYRLTNPKTREAIKASLQKVNPTLTTDDLATITIDENAALSYETFIAVKANIKFYDAYDFITLHVLLHDADFARVANIKRKINKIKNNTMTVPYNEDKSVAGNTEAIRKDLKWLSSFKGAYYEFRDDELKCLTFDPKTSGESIPERLGIDVIVHITVGSIKDSSLSIYVGMLDKPN